MSYGINHQMGIKASPEEIYKALTECGKLAGGQRTREAAVQRSGTLLNFGFMATAKNSMSRNLSRESVSPGNPRKAKVQTNGRRPKSPSIYRRVRSRPSFSFGTRAGEKVRTFKVIAR